jgi:hypothetical protein
MPKALHEALKKEAKKKGLTGDAAKRYIYGALENFKKKQKKGKKK